MYLQETRMFHILLRMVSVLEIIRRDHEQGHTAVALPGSLTVARNYLAEQCPSLLSFVEKVYAGEDIPEGLAAAAEIEASRGDNTRR
jgi:hypothetical protein